MIRGPIIRLTRNGLDTHLRNGDASIRRLGRGLAASANGRSLHFTKILDVYEEPDDDTSTDDRTYDETYWMKKSQETLDTAKHLLDVTKDVYLNPELRFNKYSIVISSSGYNQLAVRKRSGNNVLVGFRYGGKRDEIQELLESSGVQYTEQHRSFRFQMAPEMFKEKTDMFVQIAQLNKEWWVG